MNIVFDPRPGEIYDVFLSLWLANNYEYAQEEKRDYGIIEDTKFEEIIKSIAQEKKVNTKNLQRFFPKEAEPSQLLSLSSLWNNPTIDNYFEFLRNIDESKLRQIIIKLITSKDTDENYSDIETLSSDNAAVLNYIKDIEIDPLVKWEIFRLLDNKQLYIDDYIQFINEYLKTYKILEKERKKELEKFNEDFKKNIEEGGISFLKDFTNSFIDFDKYENIYITSSAPMGISVNMEPEEKSCYVIIGPRTTDIVKSTSEQNELEKNIMILKNISDSTRFQIMKKLVDRDYYGLELVKEFGITKATVSHHMNFLLLAGVVQVERKEHKAYYSLDKDGLRKIVQFLNKEFKL